MHKNSLGVKKIFFFGKFGVQVQNIGNTENGQEMIWSRLWSDCGSFFEELKKMRSLFFDKISWSDPEKKIIQYSAYLLHKNHTLLIKKPWIYTFLNLLVHTVKPFLDPLCVIFMILVSLENVKKCVLGGCTITSKKKNQRQRKMM